MIEINKKKYIISLLVTVLGIMGLISGTSYAILSGDTESTNEQVIKAGSVELQLTENYNNINTGAYIVKDEEGLLQETVYEFFVKNIGTVPAKYDLKLLNEAPSGQTAISDSYIRVGLEVNGEEMGPMGLSNVSNIIDSNTIYENEIIRYKMRIWFDINHASQIQNSTNNAYLNLSVEAKQAEYVPRTVYRWSNTVAGKGDALSVIAVNTTDYTTLNKTYFLKHSISSKDKIVGTEDCYILSNSLHCLRGYAGDGVEQSPYFENNKKILTTSFGAASCSEQTNKYTCTKSGLTAEITPTGSIRVSDSSNNCYINGFGYSACIANS